MRIAHHQQQRPDHWRTIETPVKLAETLKQCVDQDCVMIDCLNLWVSNCLYENTLIEGAWQTQQQAFLDAIEQFKGNLVIVSNEVGMGIVPLGELSRRYVDESGFLHQAVAQRCERVIFTAAGLPLVMKGPTL